jgi:hypothetical protein
MDILNAVKSVHINHLWGPKKWSLFRGGCCLDVAPKTFPDFSWAWFFSGGNYLEMIRIGFTNFDNGSIFFLKQF